MKLKSKVGEKGQVVIPKPIRDTLGIRSGEDVLFSLNGEQAIIEKKDSKKVFREFVEALPKRNLPRKIDWDKEYYSQFGD